jgi:hypothetical protein
MLMASAAVLLQPCSSHNHSCVALCHANCCIIQQEVRQAGSCEAALLVRPALNCTRVDAEDCPGVSAWRQTHYCGCRSIQFLE